MEDGLIDFVGGWGGISENISCGFCRKDKHSVVGKEINNLDTTTLQSL